MRVQNNLMALNAKRSLGGNRGNVSKSLEKLSSGFRINRAGDDAAGLSVSEKMRAQITGLDAVHDNIQNGINLVRTADGAMNEIHDILNRITNLASQAANDTYSSQERQSIQSEVDNLLSEIDRIHVTSNFNKVPLLQGNDVTVITPPIATIKGTMPAWVTMPQKDSHSLSGNFSTIQNHQDDSGKTTAYPINHSAAYLDFSQMDAGKLNDLIDNGFHTTCCTCSNHYSIKFTTGSANSQELSGNHYIYSIGIDGVTTGEQLIQKIISGTDNGSPNNHYTKFVSDPQNPNQLIIYDERSSDPLPASGGSWPNWNFPYGPVMPDGENGKFGIGVAYKYDSSSQDLKLNIQLKVGESASPQDSMKVDLPDMSLDKIDISGLSVDPTDQAVIAVQKAKAGINYVSSERGRMGSYQNRLEHILLYSDIQAENITEAESRIRDIDVADEMMAYTKSSILCQSAQAMLAQSNQVPQAVLQLMQ